MSGGVGQTAERMGWPLATSSNIGVRILTNEMYLYCTQLELHCGMHFIVQLLVKGELENYTW